LTIEVRLRDIEVDGVVYPVPTHLTWHKGPRRWAILLPSQAAVRPVIGFPARRHGGVRQAYIEAVKTLETARKATEAVLLNAHRSHVFERKKDKSLDVGIELDIQHQRVLTVHYLRVAVGSFDAGTLIKRNLRLGAANTYSKEHYDMVYAKAVETRTYLLQKHAELVLKMRAESEHQVREHIEHFLRSTES
jgi:hypothetical protein